MSMFGKKKNTDSVDNAVANSGASTAVAGKKSKKGGMAQILHESVLETVMDDFKSNEPFITKVDGKQVYVGLLLKAADIGGLDKRSKKDEAKGTIVECINSGRIKTLLTAELLNKEELVIVPDVMTLSAMDEFSLLTDAPYVFCTIDNNGAVTETDRKTSFTEVSNLIAEDGHISDIFGDKEAPDDDDDDVDLLDDEDAAPSVPDEAETVDDDIPDIDEIPDEADVPPSDFMDDIGVPPMADTSATANVPPVMDPYQAAMAEEPENVPEDNIPADWVNEAVVRHFYSDDLGLEITTEPFDVQFLQGNPFVPFNEQRPTSWMNDQLNEMSIAANLEMSRLHQNNLFLLRERYFKLISMHCDRITKDLDVNDMNTQYGQIIQQLRSNREDAMLRVDERVSRRKEEMERSWNQKLREIGDAAARSAIHQHKERYGKQHELEVYNIESGVKASIEDEYNDALHEMYDRRKMEALRLLDLGIAEVLDEVSEMYVSLLEDEKVRYEELQEGMRAFCDDNRQADIARANALAEELRQTERADQVLAEQTAKIRALNEEYNQKKHDLSSEIARIQRENQTHIEDLKAEADERVRRVEREKDALQKQVDTLLEQYQTIDEKKNKEYEGRIEEMKDEVRSLEDKCRHMMELHKRSNLVSGFMVVAAVIAALAIGFIGGEYMNINRSTREEQSRIISEFNEYQNNQADTTAAETE